MSTLPFPELAESNLSGLNVLTDETLFDGCGVRIAFTAREGGVSEGCYASLNTGGHVGDEAACVMRNRIIALEALGFAHAPLVVPKQVHGTEIVRVESAFSVSAAIEQAQSGADAVMVDVAGVGALLNFADCLPLVLVAPNGRFAVVHAGWRGALAGIAGKTARALAGGDANAAGRINAYIGPHICSECFETSRDIAGEFADAFGEGVLANGRHVSLSRVVSTDLERAGLAPERIVDARICTSCHPDRYFSYRASGGTCGRHAAIAIRR